MEFGLEKVKQQRSKRSKVKLSKDEIIRTKFTPEEDERIKQLVNEHGLHAWNIVAENIPGRTSRQCRERYHLYLQPNVSRAPWTREEDELLIAKVREFGTQWSIIAKFFRGRTNNNVKNRWNVQLKKTQEKMIIDQIAGMSSSNQNSAQSEMSEDIVSFDYANEGVIQTDLDFDASFLYPSNEFDAMFFQIDC